MELFQIIWFVLIAILFTGFFFLEGFDYGVGMLIPLVKDEHERDQLIRSIAPVWDGNEVWMITAGGAMFAAFPHVYATMFSAFYLALFLLLLALILRGVAFELRSKIDSPRWKSCWEYAIAFGSYVPAFLWGVVVADLMLGIPIAENFQYDGTFFDLVQPAAIVGGLAFVAIFLAHGSMFVTIRVQEERFIHKLRSLSIAFGRTAMICSILFLTAVAIKSRILFGSTIGSALFLLSIGAFLFSLASIGERNDRFAFFSSGLAVIFITSGVFATLFPNIMISSIDPNFNLTLYNASSTEHTLKIMTGAAFIFVPIVLIYQGFTYWIFRKRISPTNETVH